MNKKYILFIFVILVLSSVLAGTLSINGTISINTRGDSYSQSNYKLIYGGQSTSLLGDKDITSNMCKEGTDFLIQVEPLSCTPKVVRSDLLEEQDVPVFCKISGIKINPIVDVKYIRAMDFSKSDLSPGIKSVNFYPNFNAIFGETDVMNSMKYQDLGYVLIHLARNPNESAMPDFVSGNLTAKLNYDLEDAFGIRNRNFYLPEMEDLAWNYRQNQYSFWDGKGFVRAEGITENSAFVSVYTDRYESAFSKVANRDLQKYASRNLRVGEKFTLNLPGYECLAQLEVRLDAVENPETYAFLKVNSEPIQVKQGESFLDESCTVRKVDRKGLNQEVSIHCKTDEGPKTFSLSINPGIELEYSYVNGSGKTIQGRRAFNIGDKIAEEYVNEKFLGSLYLGYLGTGPTGSWDSEKLEAYFIYVPGFKEEKIPNEYLTYSKFLYEGLTSEKMFERWTKQLSGSLFSFASKLGTGVTYEPLNFQELKKVKKNIGVEIVGFDGPENYNFSEVVETNYSESKENFNIVYQDFLGNKFPIIEGDKGRVEELSEEAFIQKIRIAKALKQNLDVRTFCDEYGIYYPESENYFLLCDPFAQANGGNEYSEILVEGKVKGISLVGIYEPTFEDYGVVIQIQNTTGYSREVKLIKGVKYYLTDLGGGEEEYILLEDDLKLDSAKISGVLYSSKNNEVRSDGGRRLNSFSRTLELNKMWSDEDFYFTLKEINLNKVAKVSLNPLIRGAGSESNFGFSVGIEKRAIQLSPNKTEERIENLNKTISAFEKINSGLGTTVETMKAACVATGVGLTIKNLIENSDGKALARNLVMNRAGGWYEYCSGWETLERGYVSKEDCLMENSDKVEESVDKYHSIMEKQQEELIDISNKNVINEDASFLEIKQVSTSGSVKDFGDKVKTRLFDCIEDPWAKPGEEAKEICSSSINISLEAYERGDYSLADLRNIDLYSQILNDGTSDPYSKDIAEKELYKIVTGVTKNVEEAEARVDSAGSVSLENIFFMHGEDFSVYNVSILQTIGEAGFVKGDSLNDNTRFVKILKGDEKDYTEYVVTYEKSGKIIDTYYLKENKLEKVNSEEKNPLKIKLKINYLELGDGKSTKYLNPEVRYFEEGAYQGLPSIVPLDVKNGWYAFMKGGSYKPDSRETYLDSGIINSFYVCNVGYNGIEEKGPDNSASVDDICTMVNYFAEPLNGYQISGARSLTESNLLVRKAATNILAASRAYQQGVRSIPLEVYESGSSSEKIKVGIPEINLPDIQCMDLMSPKDCQILFNVCDPITCHSSRCDLGGQYPVKDVIQSGVIGSLMLCLPNWDEGIYAPVCLSGLHAGLDNWIMTLKGYQDCLQESLDNGRTVGICDQTQSIYLCEMFWREAAPLAKVALPKLFSKITSSGAHGGGEYLTFASSWKKAQESVKFFTDFYAADSYKAFKMRSTNEVGGLFCKSYASIVYPSAANLLDVLIRPDSPEQFTGYFDEIPFSTVTNPPTSHYKVYYQIYAGKDQGAYYRVYLRQGGSGSYFQDGFMGKIIDSDYLAPGEFIQESKDFTAPSGYKELCISVNGQEECGFGKASTSFGVNWLADKYVQQQANTTSVTTTEECVSGSFNLLSLLNLNVQEGVDNLIDPQIYQKGIIRICATNNPGEGTDRSVGTEGERWQDVGYCDEPSMRCWIDKSSLENIFEFESMKDKTLEALANASRDSAIAEGKFMDATQYENFVKKLKGEDNLFERIRLISENMNKVFLGDQKGFLYLLRGEAYGELAKEGFVVPEEPTLEEVEITCSYVESELISTLGQMNVDPLVIEDLKRALVSRGISIEGESNFNLASKYIVEFCQEIPEGYVSVMYDFDSGRSDTKSHPKLCFQYYGDSWRYKTSDCKQDKTYQDGYMTLLPGETASGAYDESPWVEVSNMNSYYYKNFNDKNKEFISSLAKVSEDYEEGFKLLVDRTLSNEEGSLGRTKLKSSSVTLDSKKGVLVGSFDFFYDVSKSSWFWAGSNDGTQVFECPTTTVDYTLNEEIFRNYSPPEKIKNIILSLNTNYDGNLYKGLLFMFEYLDGSGEILDLGMEERGEERISNVGSSYDQEEINKIISGKVNLTTYPKVYEDPSVPKCALYTTLEAKKLFGKVYSENDAWCREILDKIIWNFSSRNLNNNEVLREIINNETLTPGMIVGVYYPYSTYNPGNEDNLGGSKKCFNEEVYVRYTHNLLYLGKDSSGEPVFAESFYGEEVGPSLRKLKDFSESGFVTMVVVDSKESVNNGEEEKTPEELKYEILKAIVSIGGHADINSKGWNYSSALDITNKFILVFGEEMSIREKVVLTNTGERYVDTFVAQLKRDGLLTEDQANELSGNLFRRAKTLADLKEVLENNYKDYLADSKSSVVKEDQENEVKQGDEGCSNLGGSCASRLQYTCSENWKVGECKSDPSSNYLCCVGELNKIGAKDYVYEERDLETFKSLVNSLQGEGFSNGYGDDLVFCNCGNFCEDLAEEIFSGVSEETGLDPILFLSLIMQESKCNPLAKNSGTSAVGMTQIVPDTYKETCSSFSYVDHSDLASLDNLDAQISCGIEVLVSKATPSYINTSTNKLKESLVKRYCSNEGLQERYLSYEGWVAALRAYNGLGCSINADVDYSDKIVNLWATLDKRYDSLEESSSLANSPSTFSFNLNSNGDYVASILTYDCSSGITGAVIGETCQIVEEKEFVYFRYYGEDKFVVMVNKNFFQKVLRFFGNVFWDFSFNNEDESLGVVDVEKLPKLYNKQEFTDEFFENLKISEEDFVKSFRYFYESSKVDKSFLEKVLYARNNNLDNGYYSDSCACGSVEDCTHLAYLFDKLSKEQNVDKTLMFSIALKETSCNIHAESAVGARGIMQIIPIMIEEVCTNLNSIEEVIGEENLANNIECGIKILKNKYYVFNKGVFESSVYKNNPSFKKIVDNCVATYPSYAQYSSWSASLRSYNGWGCKEPADTSYVEKVGGFYQALSQV